MPGHGPSLLGLGYSQSWLRRLRAFARAAEPSARYRERAEVFGLGRAGGRRQRDAMLEGARWGVFLAAGLASGGAPVGAQETPPHPGRALAQKYCATCHLFPEPASLPKASWRREIEPGMARWMGREKVDYARFPEGRLLREAAPFPSAPLVTDAEWADIWTYYEQEAPAAWPATPVGSRPELKGFSARKINPASGAPQVTLVKVDAARRRLLAGDAFAGMLFTLTPAGEVEGRVRLESAPVAFTAGRAQSFLTLIGRVFPSDALEGSVVQLTSRDKNTRVRPVLEKLRRPTHTAVVDVNQDGREDLVVCAFGHLLGSLGWFENRGDGRYEEHVLLERAGALRAEVLDATGDGRPDIFVMMAQAREGLWLFVNEGGGRFRQEALLEFPPTWGLAGFELADFNRDGRVDVLAVNGDNGDFALPPKPYHGVRIYLNEGTNHFREAFFHPMPGAYRALARDFDADGDLDIAAVAFYPDFARAPAEGFVYLQNEGGLKFAALTVPEGDTGRWLTLDAGDVDGDGDEDIALGSFVRGPETTPVPTAVKDRWRTNGAAVLLLENLRR